MKLLDKKSIIITGSATGLGFATSKECLANGAYLTLVDNNEENLDKAIEELKKEYPDAKILKVIADVSNEKQVKAYIDKAKEEYGRIDGLYNNAGIEGKQASIIDYDMEVFKKVIDINLMGVYYGLRYVLPIMTEQGYGRIVNVASVGGIRGVMNQIPYVASKHAVAGMTKNAALEYGKEGITTNAIAPGAILTPMVEKAFKQMNPDDPQKAEDDYAKDNPTKRLGKPEEVAAVVTFLLSEKCGYVNGQIIAIDGGQSYSYGTV